MGRTPFEDRQARLLYCKTRLEVALNSDNTGHRIEECADVLTRLTVILKEEEQELLVDARRGRVR